MNWIILFLAGLFEVSLTFCLGKTREASGIGFYLWGSGFLASTVLSMALLAKAVQTLPYWYIRIQGACHSHPAFLPVHAYRFLDRVENRVILRKEAEDEV